VIIDFLDPIRRWWILADDMGVRGGAIGLASAPV